jgi:PAS domain S-box-containing protein
MEDPNQGAKSSLPDRVALEALLTSSAFALGYLEAGKVRWANRALAEAFGYRSEDELVGTSWADLCEEEPEPVPAGDIMPHGPSGARSGAKESRFKRRDGSGFSASPAFVSVRRRGERRGDTWVAIDPSGTETKEQGLRESAERYRILVEGSFDGIFLRQGHRIVFANARLSQMLGYSEAELTGLDRWEIYHPDDRRIVQERTSARIAGEHVTPRYDVRLLRRDGTSFPAELDARVFHVEGQPLIQVCVRDISERKRAEEERLQLVTAIEHAAEIIAITDTSAAVKYINSAVETITGYARTEIIGHPLHVLGKGPHDAASYAAMVATLGQGKVWSGRTVNRKKDGSPFETEVSISPLRGDDHEVIGYVAVMRDVTNEVALEAQLRQAAKMEALGTLAGGIAHDFNNIIYVIMGFAEIALNATSAETRLKSYLRQVLLAANRAKDLVEQILTFSRQSERQKHMVSVIPLVEETLTFLRASIPTTVDIRPHLDAEADVIKGDPTQIHQIIMNLCSNAAHAMGQHGGTLDVRLTTERFGTEHQAPLPGMTEESYLLLSVQDTGHGMKPEVMERIFEPYYSTKEKGQGTGLGLAVVHGIVKDHGGAIAVRSEPGKGTVFDVYLPLVHSDGPASVRETETVPTGRQRILVVDDESAVTAMLEAMLDGLGYLVETCNSSVDALALFRERGDRFDLVITDLTMPIMTGVHLARELLDIRASIPVILCTGHTQLMSESEAKKMGMKALLVKPVTRSKLGRTIRKVLEKT